MLVPPLCRRTFSRAIQHGHSVVPFGRTIAPRRLCTKPPADPGIDLRPRTFNLGVKSDDGVPIPPDTWLARLHSLARSRLHQGLLLHGGRALMALAVFSDDWATVRLSLMGGSLFQAVFHFLFPVPRPARMAWGALFLVGHAVALYRQCKEHLPIPLSDEEAAMYERGQFKECAGRTQCNSLPASR